MGGTKTKFKAGEQRSELFPASRITPTAKKQIQYIIEFYTTEEDGKPSNSDILEKVMDAHHKTITDPTYRPLAKVLKTEPEHHPNPGNFAESGGEEIKTVLDAGLDLIRDKVVPGMKMWELNKVEHKGADYWAVVIGDTIQVKRIGTKYLEGAEVSLKKAFEKILAEQSRPPKLLDNAHIVRIGGPQKGKSKQLHHLLGKKGRGLAALLDPDDIDTAKIENLQSNKKAGAAPIKTAIGVDLLEIPETLSQGEITKYIYMLPDEGVISRFHTIYDGIYGPAEKRYSKERLPAFRKVYNYLVKELRKRELYAEVDKAVQRNKEKSIKQVSHKDAKPAKEKPAIKDDFPVGWHVMFQTGDTNIKPYRVKIYDRHEHTTFKERGKYFYNIIDADKVTYTVERADLSLCKAPYLNPFTPLNRDGDNDFREGDYVMCHTKMRDYSKQIEQGYLSVEPGYNPKEHLRLTTPDGDTILVSIKDIYHFPAPEGSRNDAKPAKAKPKAKPAPPAPEPTKYDRNNLVITNATIISMPEFLKNWNDAQLINIFHAYFDLLLGKTLYDAPDAKEMHEGYLRVKDEMKERKLNKVITDKLTERTKQ